MGRKVACILLFILTLVFAVSLSGSSAKVYIDRIGGYDAVLVNYSGPVITSWVETTGNTPTTSRKTADYVVRFNVIDVSVSHPFNWVIFLLPFWPIVPFTTLHVEVMLSITVVNAAGDEVFSNQAGGEASAWFFADFVAHEYIKRDAFNVAFRRLVVSARL